jgi:6,7-dimethyl-8-ribityllumazine synthase
MVNTIKGDLTAAGLRIAIIASRFNEEITSNLINGAVLSLQKNGVEEKDITLYYVPGAYEIPSVLEKICRKNDKHKFDGILTVGCVIKGETAHFEYISSAVSHNINFIASKYSVPVGFCVLTTYTDEQAEKRSRMENCNAENNKGFEAAESLIETINLMNRI